MAKLEWDKTGERFYETGVDHGVLYIPNNAGVYATGYTWNGLTTVTESPSGAESNPQYADNIKYLNLLSAEEFGATVEAFTYPDEFGQCDGTASPSPGVVVGQQRRKNFGLSYRTRVGNDIEGTDLGYKIHLIWGAQAAPAEKAYNTINDSPEAITFSWELTTTPTAVGTINGVDYKPAASMTIDSTKVDPAELANLEDVLYGTASQDPRLPTPAEVIAMFGGAPVIEVTPNAPTFADPIITIPTQTGVIYSIDDVDRAPGSTVVISEPTLVTARPASGYKFPAVVDNDWVFDPA